MKNTLINIAIADDHSLVIEGLRCILEASGLFAVMYTAKSGQQLLHTLESSEIHPDICILDVRMTPLNGFETMSIIKDRWPHVKGVGCSVYGTAINVLQMLKCGGMGFFSKNDDPDIIINTIKGVEAGSKYISPTILEEHPQLNMNDINVLYKTLPSKVEITFLSHLCEEKPYKEIADEMNKSTRTIHSISISLMEKFKVKSKTGLIVIALKLGLGKSTVSGG